MSLMKMSDVEATGSGGSLAEGPKTASKVKPRLWLPPQAHSARLIASVAAACANLFDGSRNLTRNENV